MPANRPGERHALDVAPDTGQLGHAVRMVDAGDLLLDDRALVELLGDVVRRRADELHPARMGLRIGPRSPERRQERVVNVDRPTRQGAACVAAEDLHVAREHHQLDPLGCHQLQERGIPLRSRCIATREAAVRDAIPGGQAFEVAVRRGDGHDVGVQGARLPAVEQVVQAMALARDGHQDALSMAGVMEVPLHGVCIGQRRKGPPPAL
jgi:hypothetical protein